MRRILIIAAAVLGTIVIIAAAILFYAASNLNAIIAVHRQTILDRVSLALGRDVQASDITATLGWGITADLKNVKIGDDPLLAQMPFVEASDVYARLQLAPLLGRRIEVSEVSLDKPVIRIIQMKDGRLNVSTIGKQPQSAAAQKDAEEKAKRVQAKGSPLGSLFVQDFAIKNGTLIYQQEGEKQSAIVNAIDLSVKGFGFNAPFNVALTMAAFAEKENIAVDATLGPLLKNGAFDVSAMPFSVKAKVGPILLSQLRAIQMIAKSIPPKLTIPQPVSLAAQADGTIAALKFQVSSDLSSDQITFGNSFNKPADTKLNVTAEGARTGSVIEVKVAQVALGDLDLKATSIKVGGGNTSARVDSNAFDLAALAKMLPDLAKYDPAGKTEIHADVAIADGKPVINGSASLAVGDLDLKATKIHVGGGKTSARVDTNNFDLGALPKEEPALAKQVAALAKYNLGGKAEIHADVTIVDGKPQVNGTVALEDVSAAQPEQKIPALSKLNGKIKLAGNSGDVGPLTFNLGPAQGTLKSHVVQLQPLLANYDLTAGAIRLADFVPARPPDEQINQLAATGGIAMQPGGVSVTSKITSPSGNLANMPYQNLDLSVALDSKRARVQSLKMKAFSGDISATAEAQLGPSAPFSASMNFSNLDLQQLLASQKSKSADTVRGILTGNMNASAVAGPFEQMKPTFKGDGKLSIVNGKLIGINIGGDALKKVQNLPAIGNLVPAAVIGRHPELFANPDTDIQTASLSYVLAGPRITSHDIKVQTVDYSLLGDGWFDLDQNIDLGARIVLSQAFSKELVQQNQNIQYVANKDGQVDFPLQITGRLPKPIVLPNVTELAQRAATRAAQNQGQKYLGKVLGKKGIPAGLGGLLGLGPNDTSTGAGAPGAGAPPSGPSGGPGTGNKPANPLDQLKKLF